MDMQSFPRAGQRKRKTDLQYQGQGLRRTCKGLGKGPYEEKELTTTWCRTRSERGGEKLTKEDLEWTRKEGRGQRNNDQDGMHKSG